MMGGRKIGGRFARVIVGRGGGGGGGWNGKGKTAKGLGEREAGLPAFLDSIA